MAGSSGMHFARAAYQSGMVSRRPAGALGPRARALSPPGLDRRAHAPRSCRRSRSSSPACRSATSSAWRRTCWRASCRASTRRCSKRSDAHQDAGRATFIVSAAGNGAGRDPGRACSAWTAASARGTRSTATACLTGGIVEPFVYGEGKVEAMRALRRRARHRPRTPRGPTRTPPRTCRCCARSGTRWRSTPTPSWPRVAPSEGWRVMRFEKLGRRLAIAGATVIAALRSAGWARCSRAGDPRRPAARRLAGR